MITVYVLVTIQAGNIPAVVEQLRRVDGVREATMTLGPYDAVVTLQAQDIKHLGNILTKNIQPIPGVIETLTCLSIEV